MSPQLCSFFSVRGGHGEGEDIQAVHQKAQWGREKEDPPGQRTQVHVYVPATAHLLFPLQRVYMVRQIASLRSRIITVS